MDVPPLCGVCMEKTGLPPPSRPVRPPSPCGRCGHREIVRVRMRERTTVPAGDSNAELARPFALTWQLGEDYKSLFSFQKVETAQPDLGEPAGLLEAYVCRACGSTELYARRPDEIPIGPEYGTELIVVPGDGSYR